MFRSGSQNNPGGGNQNRNGLPENSRGGGVVGAASPQPEPSPSQALLHYRQQKKVKVIILNT